jgi:hypothetical protein
MPRYAVVLAVFAAALPLGACSASDIPGVGGDDSGTQRGKAAAAVVKRFSEATGPEACDMLTPAALRAVYGKDEPAGPPREITEPPPPVSLAECRRRSARFKGDKVEIDKVDILGDGRAIRVQAMSAAGDRTFVVTLRLKGKTWLIDEIREQ